MHQTVARTRLVLAVQSRANRIGQAGTVVLDHQLQHMPSQACLGRQPERGLDRRRLKRDLSARIQQHGQIGRQFREHLQATFQPGRLAAQRALFADVPYPGHHTPHARIVQVTGQADRQAPGRLARARRTPGCDHGRLEPRTGAHAFETRDEFASAWLIEQVVERNAQRVGGRSAEHIVDRATQDQDAPVVAEQQRHVVAAGRQGRQPCDRVATASMCEALGRDFPQANHRHAFGFDLQQRGRQVHDQAAAVGGSQLRALLQGLAIEQAAPQHPPAPSEIPVAGVPDQFRQVPADQRVALRAREQREGFVGRQDLGRRVKTDRWPGEQFERLAFQRRFDCRLPQGNDCRTQVAFRPGRHVGFMFAFKRYRMGIVP